MVRKLIKGLGYEIDIEVLVVNLLIGLLNVELKYKV